MDDTVEMRVRSAAAAGWRTFLIGAGFMALQWVLYLIAMSSRPDWFLVVWGPNIGWDAVGNVWFWTLAFFKVCLWLLALVALWLTLWAKQLRKAG